RAHSEDISCAARGGAVRAARDGSCHVLGPLGMAEPDHQCLSRSRSRYCFNGFGGARSINSTLKIQTCKERINGDCNWCSHLEYFISRVVRLPDASAAPVRNARVSCRE